MATIFFSYSHANEAERNQLEVHFAMLKREGLVDTWHDRCLTAGDEFDPGIKMQLEKADIILFLVSPEFLASRYCFDVEMQRAIERHKAGEARVMPIILDTCDWLSSPMKEFLALPRDGKPVSKYANVNDAYLEVVHAIRKALTEMDEQGGDSAEIDFGNDVGESSVTDQLRSSNLGIRKEFTDHDRDEFLIDSFEYVQRFFENSLGEMESRNPEVKTRFRRINANEFTSEIYLNGETASSCSICIPEHGMAGKHSITYGTGTKSSANSFGDAISVVDDSRDLGFSAMNYGMMMSGSQKEELLSKEGAAEYLWGRLIQPLQ